MAKRKDYGAMERSRAAAPVADRAREALRTRITAPPSRLPIDQLQPNPLNPRPEEDEGLAALADTMRQHGQLQQIEVVSRVDFVLALPESAEALSSAPWVVIIGNRRLAAAAIADLSSLEVKAPEGITSADQIESRILVENLQRSDLPVLQEAEFLQRQLNRGRSLRAIASTIGKSFAYVQQRVNLLKLIPELQELVSRGELGIKAARNLYSLSPENQALVAQQGPPWLPPAVRKEDPVDAGPGHVESGGNTASPATAPQSVATAEQSEAATEATTDVPVDRSDAARGVSADEDASTEPTTGVERGGSSNVASVATQTRQLVLPLAGGLSTLIEELRQVANSSADGDAVESLRQVERQLDAALSQLRRL
ncbi:ParB/RepB/Spo0J family partition protein [Pseudonocardia sp. ICBG1142]|uniref:ParB/RepB/Spo0J family partition protein n=1 Tax=Pseudonocardia sp. ICBG1142 TaxID=2846760 RepID=UPI001CF651C4|nr:ParB/RepB/Spo0J family partition protein [Pseudonocardia sp. ICBG1142]